MSEDSNGSTGRFLRMEEKLDTLIAQTSGFQLDVVQRLTRLEVTTVEARSKLETAASDARDKLGVSASEARGKMEIDAGNARAAVSSGISSRAQKWAAIGIVLAFVMQFAAFLFNAIRIADLQAK